MEKIAGQARNDRPATVSVQESNGTNGQLDGRNALSGWTVIEGCGSSPQDPKSFPSPELSPTLPAVPAVRRSFYCVLLAVFATVSLCDTLFIK
jgi:hypothetical protein